MGNGIMDGIYWRLHTSYLRNNHEKAKHFAALMDVEHAAGGDLLGEIGEAQHARYVRIRDNMARGDWMRLCRPGYSSPSSPGGEGKKKEKTQAEKDICQTLKERSKELMHVAGLSDKATMHSESEMAPYGRCDFVSLDRPGRTTAAIEVKAGEAPSSVISQVDKYMLCLELDMIRQSHDNVVGFVVAESFSWFVSSELSRSGVGMIQFRGDAPLRLIVPRSPA